MSKIPRKKTEKSPYFTWSNENKGQLAEHLGKVSANYNGFCHTVDNWCDFSDIEGISSGRPGLSWDDYDYHRPKESLPKKHRHIMYDCNRVYKEEGIVKNTIDLMADFTCQGIRISHPVARHENLFRAWWKKINGVDVSERFANYLYRLGNVIVRRGTGKLNEATKEKLRVVYAEELDILKQKKGIIPTSYRFINPLIVDSIGSELDQFIGSKVYGIKIPEHVKSKFKMMKASERTEILKTVPEDLANALKSGKDFYKLPRDQVEVYHYKKDDWDSWAKPITYSVLRDIYTLQKLKLADRAALDGAISNVRIFKLGSLEHEIMPGEELFQLLDDTLQSHTGGGTMDLVWGPDIEIIESRSEVYKFLGEEKYKPHLSRIYEGYGIPPTLTGASTSGGTTNNFISLKTLIQRLEYGRSVLKSFWYNEIERFRQAMGISKKAIIEFDNPNLTDSAQEKKLLLEMADRNLISDEMLFHCFNHDPVMEKIRIQKQSKKREVGKSYPKYGPFHRDNDFIEALKKIGLQQGFLNLDQFELDLPDSEEPTQREIERLQMEQEKESDVIKSPGRPPGEQDQLPRQRRSFQPIGKSAAMIMEVWARDYQEKVAEYLKPYFLKSYKKNNLRKLTAQEFENMEKVKFGVLFNTEPLQKFSAAKLGDLISQKLPIQEYKRYKRVCSDISKELGKDLTVAQQRTIQSTLYIDYKNEIT